MCIRDSYYLLLTNPPGPRAQRRVDILKYLFHLSKVNRESPLLVLPQRDGYTIKCTYTWLSQKKVFILRGKMGTSRFGRKRPLHRYIIFLNICSKSSLHAVWWCSYGLWWLHLAQDVANIGFGCCLWWLHMSQDVANIGFVCCMMAPIWPLYAVRWVCCWVFVSGVGFNSFAMACRLVSGVVLVAVVSFVVVAVPFPLFVCCSSRCS